MGIKYAVTLDYETLNDLETVTIRERDSMSQIRINVIERIDSNGLRLNINEKFNFIR